MLLKKFIVKLYWKFLTTHFVFKSNNYLCRCVRVGWGRFRASTRLVKWSHFKARARAATPGKCGYIKEHEHYTIYFLPKNQKDSVKSQKDSVSPRFSEKTQKMHTIIFLELFLKSGWTFVHSCLDWLNWKNWAHVKIILIFTSLLMSISGQRIW